MGTDMVIDSKYTKTFASQGITRLKYDELHSLAVSLRDHKNDVSAYVNENLIKYLEYSKLDFITEMRERYKGIVGSSFYNQLYTQVYTCYSNKFNNIKRKLKFERITVKGYEHYRRDTKDHRKGDLKRVVVEREQTLLSSCLTYLARYGNENTVQYIKDNIDACTEDKRKFYGNILRLCDKFGFERLYSLAMSRRKRIIEHYAEEPIEFKSLSFSGRSRKSKVIAYNKRFGSAINAFVSLSGFGRKSLDIPVKFSRGWHGSMKGYMKKTNDYEYTVTFDEIRHGVRVNICKDGERYIPFAGDRTVGIDVNCKHNLMSLSDRTTYDYDRKLVNDFCKMCADTDRLKKANPDYKVGKRRQRKMDVMRMKMVKSEQQTIACMCKTLQSQGYNHIVMEDLDNGFGRSYFKDRDNSDINYNRKVGFLGLSSVKNEVEHIARKYGIAVSTVHASYTSKMCPVCGCIEDENRPDQETFRCIGCGHEDNADFNAAVNIRNRVDEAVLREPLLKQLDNGAYEPRNVKRETVKKVLLSHRSSALPKGNALRI